MNNVDKKTVLSFGDEWGRFDQSGMKVDEAKKVFDEYFAVFPWEDLPEQAEGFDMGCGSGRWALFVAPRVGVLNCIDPSDAIDVSRRNLEGLSNIRFFRAFVGEEALPSSSQDFGYSLGVLHHVPDTGAAIQSCVNLLKPGAPLLLYLYYAFDNRPWWFRTIWKLSDGLRSMICGLPPKAKGLLTDAIAVTIYYPLAKVALSLEKIGVPVSNLPLSYYRNHSFYTMRTDARDRFGTPLEKRFKKAEIESLMVCAGLFNIRFSKKAPFWCAVGFRRQD